MSKKLALILFLSVFVPVVFAQSEPELSESVVDPISGLTAQYPSDWYYIQIETPQGGIKLSSKDPRTLTQGAIQPDEWGVEVLPPQQVAALVGDADFEDSWELILERTPGDPGDAVDVDDYPNRARYLTSEVQAYTITVGLVELDDGVYALLLGTTHPDTVEEALPFYYAIGGNLSVTETASNTIFASTLMFTDESDTFAFTYPNSKGWTAYEDNGTAIVTNAKSLEDFSADDGQYLIVVNAVPADEADESALFGAMLPVQNFAFPIPPFLINADGSENTNGAALEGLVGKQAGDDVSVAMGTVSAQDQSLGIEVAGSSQANFNFTTDADLVALIKVYGPAGENELVAQILSIVANSLHVPVNLSSIEPSDIDLSETWVEGQITIHYPKGWESYFRGGLNVAGIPEDATDAVRLIMSARNLEAGETAEDALHSFVEMFGYDTFESIELTDGRTAYIGTTSKLSEAVLTVQYNNDIVVTMSLLPNNPADFKLGLPIALAILEAFEIDV